MSILYPTKPRCSPVFLPKAITAIITSKQLSCAVEDLAEKATEKLLQKSNKRLCLPLRGAEGIFVKHLRPCNINKRQDIVEKAEAFDQKAPIIAAESTG